MKESLKQFIEAHLPLDGLAAWSARLPDRTLTSHCLNGWFTPKQVEQAVTRLALAAENLNSHSIEPARLCWVFEHARIHVALRGDKACLALFVENRPVASNAALESALEEFNGIESFRSTAVPLSGGV